MSLYWSAAFLAGNIAFIFSEITSYSILAVVFSSLVGKITGGILTLTCDTFLISSVISNDTTECSDSPLSVDCSA